MTARSCTCESLELICVMLQLEWRSALKLTKFDTEDEMTTTCKSTPQLRASHPRLEYMRACVPRQNRTQHFAEVTESCQMWTKDYTWCMCQARFQISSYSYPDVLVLLAAPFQQRSIALRPKERHSTLLLWRHEHASCVWTGHRGT